MESHAASFPGCAEPTGVETVMVECNTLLSELEQFRKHLVQQKKEHMVEMRTYQTRLRAELKALEKVSKKGDTTDDDAVHHLRSSNLPFHTAVWNTAKTCKGIKGFNLSFQCTKDEKHAPNGQSSKDENPPPHGEKKSHKNEKKHKNENRPKKSIIVDIVADNGSEWIKVSTITESKILFELAENGWHQEEDDDDEEEPENKDDFPTLSLLVLAKDLQRAAAACVQSSYSRPRVRLVLPKLISGRYPIIDLLLEQIRATGTMIQCAPDLPQPPPALDTSTLTHMTIDEFVDFTPTLNIDCTILLALVSDLSHQEIIIEPEFHVAIRRQIERERTDQVMPSLLWPAMGERELVCTSQAAQRMHEIVETIGTPSEKARTAILMGMDGNGTPLEKADGNKEDEAQGEDNKGDGKDGNKAMIAAFQKYSSHQVPSNWKIPIRTIPSTAAEDIDIGALPPIAKKVKESLTPINQSVFLFGWKEGVTTLSSNRTVVRTIMDILCGGSDHNGGGDAVEVNGADGEAHGEENDEGEEKADVVKEDDDEKMEMRMNGLRGPQIWLCPTARSLLGKEKSRR
ncbi:MAG: hypothetical protein M1823_000935 [Watsoniomyces obsoletus]|nr:MAG: hypothetical protein M1823_000935 [Watsoniomyces obsoletus]